MKLLVVSLEEKDKFCGINHDEMSISESLYYDLKSDEFLGSITLPGHGEKASKALVFMIVGLCWRWKLNK